MALAFTACAPDAPHDNPLDPSSSFFTGTGSVRGVVALLRDPREGIPSAQVCILPSGPIVLTAADGSFVLSSVPTGSVDLTAGKDGFRPDTLTVQIEAGNAASIDFRLDALPTVTLQRIVTRKIDAYFPGPAYFATISATVGDDDGPADIDSVWCTIANFTSGMSFNPDSHHHEVTLVNSQLPTNNLQWLVGKEVCIHCTDVEGATASVGDLYVTRIIEDCATPVSPAPGDTANPSPLLEWRPAPVAFLHTLTLQIVQQYSGTQTPIWSQEGVDPNLWSFQYPSTLAQGSYFWTITVVDEFGNMSQGKPCSFTVN